MADHASTTMATGEVVTKAAMTQEGSKSSTSYKTDPLRLSRLPSMSVSIYGNTPVIVEDQPSLEAGKPSASAIVVGFDGKDDPADPHNWSIR